MLYFDLAIYKEELLTDREKSFPKFFQNIIYNFRKITGQVLKLKINDKNLIVLPKINRRILRKVDKKPRRRTKYKLQFQDAVINYEFSLFDIHPAFRKKFVQY